MSRLVISFSKLLLDREHFGDSLRCHGRVRLVARDAGKRTSIETINLNSMPLLQILLLYFLPYRRISGYCI